MAVKKYDKSHTYSILLILTNCSNNDMPNTVKEIIKALNAPLSIVIIGFGHDLIYINIINDIIKISNLKFASVFCVNSFFLSLYFNIFL